jgi:neutral ceramidase
LLVVLVAVLGELAVTGGATMLSNDDAEEGGTGTVTGNVSNGGYRYMVGTGMADMTGPAAQVNFMGYAVNSQNGHGIHMRLRSRAFIISSYNDDHDNGIGSTGRTDATAAGIIRQEGEGDENKDESIMDSNTGMLTKFLWRGGSSSFNNKSGGKSRQTKNSPQQPDPVPDPESTICVVSMDAGMGSDILTKKVLERFAQLVPPTQQGSKPVCHLENTSISGTHTHSSPGGFLQYTLYQMTSKGWVGETFNTMVEQIAQSMMRAYSNLQPADISVAQELLWESNINRSPTSYLLNPQEERDKYAQEGDTDKNMVLLKFASASSQNEQHPTGTGAGASPPSVKDLGMINWFAVHGTSMNNTNLLISGDNKGYASYQMEQKLNGNRNDSTILPGQGDFVAAFASTNLGDVSPNTAGPRCLDTGLSCDGEASTCQGRNELCVAFGPGVEGDMMESTQIIGQRQYEHALRLYHNESLQQVLHPAPIAFRHAFVDMAHLTIHRENGANGSTVQTCPAALGYSFAAGTTDGPGQFDFTQHTNTSNPFWNTVSHFLSKPSQTQIDCQAPKPILLNTGEITLPYAWDPATVPISIFRLSPKFYILNVPCEFTTMAGRRLRAAIKQVVQDHNSGGDVAISSNANVTVVIAGLANSYTHYVTTYEEYQAQRYEAASTLYGPHTLEGYIQEFKRLTTDLLTNEGSATDKEPDDLLRHQISFLNPVLVDNVPLFKKFGQVHKDVVTDQPYISGKDTVAAEFHSANPRNNQRLEGTFLTVDRLNEEVNKDNKDDSSSWTTKYVDGDWCTKFIWKGDGGEALLGISYARIEWDIPSDAPPGKYRICHYGTRKHLITSILPDSWQSFSNRYASWSNGAKGSTIISGMSTAVVRLILEMVAAIDTKLTSAKYLWNELQRSRYQDFEGCSSTFQVV